MDYENDVLFDQGNLRSLDSETRNQESKTQFLNFTGVTLTAGLLRTTSFMVVPHEKRAENDQERGRSSKACPTVRVRSAAAYA